MPCLRSESGKKTSHTKARPVGKNLPLIFLQFCVLSSQYFKMNLSDSDMRVR